MEKICFEPHIFYTYVFILISILLYFIYYFMHLKESFGNTFDPYISMDKDTLYNTILKLKDQLYDIQLKEQKCQQELTVLSNNNSIINNQTQSKFLNKIYNPLYPPENIYPAGKLYSPGYDGYMQYQMLGYLNCSQGRFPVFGRYKYPGKTDKYEYYTIDDSRGRIKIPFKTKNYNELFDGDNITIDEIGTCVFKKYENEEFRYNPNY